MHLFTQVETKGLISLEDGVFSIWTVEHSEHFARQLRTERLQQNTRDSCSFKCQIEQALQMGTVFLRLALRQRPELSLRQERVRSNKN